MAKEIYAEELFNLGMEESGEIHIRPPFEEFVEKLDLMTLCYQIDNDKSKSGLKQENHPSKEDQKTKMEALLADYSFDFLPKSANQVYHIVSMEWFEAWKAFVEMEKKEEPTPTEEKKDIA